MKPCADYAQLIKTLCIFSLTKPNYTYLQLKLGVKDAHALREKILDEIKALNFKELGQDVKPFLFNPEDARKVELFPEFIAQVLLQ